nr:GGDEF domain-containing protein [Oceanobacter mangrovi]
MRDDKVIASFGELALKPDIRPDVLFRLTGKLQTSLELPQLIEIFFREIQASVPVDGITYRFRPYNLVVSQGKTSAHSVSYDLKTQSETIGELVFYRSSRLREFELANIEGLLSTLLFPLRNALRYREALDAAFRDPLTGAGNRVALDRTLDREVELCHRHEQALSLLMIDMDHFKNINDSHGHTTGDAVLKEAVAAITDCIRQTDLCFRYGGEEFLVLLSNASQEDAMVVAERIRNSISRIRLPVNQGLLKVTSSIGCASLQATDSRKSLIDRADQALYLAKRTGRDKVIGEEGMGNSLLDQA